jgi:hypothetical protein
MLTGQEQETFTAGLEELSELEGKYLYDAFEEAIELTKSDSLDIVKSYTAWHIALMITYVLASVMLYIVVYKPMI